jgi:hypothetical protein
MSSDKRIVITLHGSPNDSGHLRLSEFIKELESIRAALKQTERLVTGAEESSVYYKVVDLSHNSPATITLEPSPLRPLIDPNTISGTVDTFFSNLRQIVEQNQTPKGTDLMALEAYRDIGAMLEKHISQITISGIDAEVQINTSYNSKIVDIIGPDETIQGSISGRLEWINIHNVGRFHIYPIVGPKKIVCNFPETLKSKVKSAIDQEVEVHGELRYKRMEKYPYAVTVSDLFVLPDEAELPKLAELRGVAPDATDGQPPQDFVEFMRNEIW